MSMRMLVDASHPEETRVAVTRGTRLEAFEFESASKKQLKGNIYLAKVTRVEPSLQAAFVDYGGNRHGFLAFNEIHPDYYQIPVQDRKGLIESQSEDDEENSGDSESESPTSDDGVESLGGEDDLDEDIKRRSRALRQYKIQEVVKRRQILLVQVVKEERGTKGAALTTYMSLAGRYCVLMPNTARGGGISRKIINPSDRKRLKEIATSLGVPEGMGVIIRTAGLNRTKPEIKRDYDYLLRTWTKVRDLTLESSAPCLVHEEGDLIRRGIRDLYNKDISEILVAGDEGYKAAKGFMKTLMPSQAKVVQPYKDDIPLFNKYEVEREIDEMFSPRVTLKSGAYLIINPTEALVAIDVNSGRSTKERNIEGTAYRTNLEAAEEIARQVRLRDLAGLIVIDFIDMEVSKNVRAVEAKMKECLKVDRARIQVGRISSFGLMEMSRQRLRPDLLEASTNACPACGGAGVVRSKESTSLAVIRSIEEECMRSAGGDLTVVAPAAVAIYLLNNKRSVLHDIEQRYQVSLDVQFDDALIAPDHRIERRTQGEDSVASKPKKQTERKSTPEGKSSDTDDGAQPTSRRRRGRRRRTRRGSDETENNVEASGATEEAVSEAPAEETGAEVAPDTAQDETTSSADKPARRRRRSRRGGRGRSRTSAASGASETATEAASDSSETKPDSTGNAASETASETDAASDTSADDGETAVPEKKPRRARTRTRKPARRRTKPATDAPTASEEEESSAPKTAETPAADWSEPTGETAIPLAASSAETPAASTLDGEASTEKPKRRGWWQRK